MLQITKGSANVSVVIRVVDSTDGTPETSVSHDTSGIDLWYRREGAAKTSITEAALAALTTAHTDGGVEPIADGWVRLDLPDAACATGVAGVQIGGTITGMIVHAPYIQLTDLDLFDAVRAGLTALPNADADAAGGLVISDTGGLDADAMAASVTAIEVDTATTLDTKINDLQGAGFATATDSNEALRNRGDAAWTGSQRTSDTGTAQAGSSTTITLAATAPSVDNILEGHRVDITAGTGVGGSKAIAENGYDGTTKVATIIGAWEVNPDATSVYEVIPDVVTEVTVPPTVVAIVDGVWDETRTGHSAANTFGENCGVTLDAVLSDTGELQTDWADGGRLDLIVDAILVDTGNLDTDWADGGRLDLIVDAILVDTGNLDTDWADGGRLDLIVDAILADTGELQTDWVNGGRLDLLVDLILADTGELQTDWADAGRLDAILDARASQTSLDALNDIAVVDVLTTQMTESYAADGVAPTIAEALFLVQQALTDFAISGTALTVKKLDGSTTAATMTLNDASTPTSLTRTG